MEATLSPKGLDVATRVLGVPLETTSMYQIAG